MKNLFVAAILSLTVLGTSFAFADDATTAQNSDSNQNLSCVIWPFC